jgi:predicted kinase
LQKATLHVMSGKLASGKTTLARQIAAESGALLVCEDVWLDRLFPGEIVTFGDYLTRSARFRSALAPHVQDLLRAGVSVVFDFAGNIPRERAWARTLCDADTTFIIHFVRASDELCKRQLRRRNADLPAGSQSTTDEEFDAITRYFVPPELAEADEILEYDRDAAAGVLDNE